VTQAQLRVLARTLGVLAFGVCFVLVLDRSTGGSSDRLSSSPLSATKRSMPAPAPARVPAVLDGPSATPGTTSSPFVGMPMVGAVFLNGEGGHPGDHFCTASVVDSPGGDVIISAAHCLTGSPANTVFIPGYRDGHEPYGAWPVLHTVEDPNWTANTDPDYDVAFAVLGSLHGKEIQQVVGGNTLAVNKSPSQLITLTGYPESSNAPITCSNYSASFSPTQMRITCANYTDGTSGSPWVIPGKHGSGTVIGVIGGFEQGGYTPDVSYSVYFGGGVQGLYQQAVTMVR